MSPGTINSDEESRKFVCTVQSDDKPFRVRTLLSPAGLFGQSRGSAVRKTEGFRPIQVSLASLGSVSPLLTEMYRGNWRAGGSQVEERKSRRVSVWSLVGVKLYVDRGTDI